VILVAACAALSLTALPSAAAREAATPSAKVVFVDVGAGDAVIIRIGDTTVLSDIGEFNIADLYEQLRKLGTDEIDAIILSHAHDDHIKNFELLLDSGLYPVRRALLSRTDHWQMTETNRDVLRALRRHDVPRTYVRAGQVYHFGGARWTILNPAAGAFTRRGQDGNVSIVYLLELNGKRLLFTGDIERAGEQAVLSRWNESEPIDLMLATHHGSRNASHTFFLDVVKPKVAVISVGKGHGHPHLDAVQRLRDTRANLWCTNWNGTVTATLPPSASGRIRISGSRHRAAWWLRSEHKTRGPCVGKELEGE
jgi:competence protein ComEC